MTGPPVIQLQDVSFYYGDIPVLTDVSLSIGTSRVISVVGPNGGGKTTLLKLILGLLRPTSGTVRVFGAAPKDARRRIGYTPQYMHYDPQFPVSVRDVVLMGRVERHHFGRYSRADRDAARTALEEVELEGLAGRGFDALSGGQRQRVLIARALAGEPELLLLDEPTSNMDVLIENRLFDILSRLKERMTILLVSHDLGFVSERVEEVICVNRRVVMHPTSDVTGQVIQDVYGADIRMVRHDHETGEPEAAHE